MQLMRKGEKVCCVWLLAICIYHPRSHKKKLMAARPWICIFDERRRKLRTANVRLVASDVKRSQNFGRILHIFSPKIARTSIDHCGLSGAAMMADRPVVLGRRWHDEQERAARPWPALLIGWRRRVVLVRGRQRRWAPAPAAAAAAPLRFVQATT